MVEDVEPLVRLAADARTGAARAVDVDAALDGARVVGTVSQVYGMAADREEGVLVRVEYSRIAPKHRLRAWVELLAVTAAWPQRPWRAVTLGRGTHSGMLRSTLGPVDPGRAAGLLAGIVALHRHGLREPLPLATSTSYAYATGRVSGGSQADGRARAAQEWARDRAGRDDAGHRLVWGPAAPFDTLLAQPPRPDEPGPPDESTRFGALASALWAPLFAAETVEHL